MVIYLNDKKAVFFSKMNRIVVYMIAFVIKKFKLEYIP